MSRMDKGGREQIHSEAVLSMLGRKPVLLQCGDASDDSDGEDGEEGEEGEEADDASFSSSSSSDKKYHRCLPTHADPEARVSHKDL